MILGSIVPVMQGMVVCVSEYPSLGLTYYGISYYDFRRRCSEIVFIEHAKLIEMMKRY